MRSFADLDALIGMVPAQVVTRLSAIDFGRGSEALHRDQMPGLLTELSHQARVQSITASSAIEGVVVADVGRAEQRTVVRKRHRFVSGSDRCIESLEGRGESLEILGVARGTNVGVAGPQRAAVQHCGDTTNDHIAHIGVVQRGEDRFGKKATRVVAHDSRRAPRRRCSDASMSFK